MLRDSLANRTTTGTHHEQHLFQSTQQTPPEIRAARVSLPAHGTNGRARVLSPAGVLVKPGFQEQTMVKAFWVALSLPALLLVSACNTVEGIGEDVQSAGNAIEETAD